MSKIRVRLLGGFEVWEADREVGGFESRKVRALLAYLACQRRRAFSRDHLAGLLWPDKDADAARHALRQALYNLKSRLPAGESGAAPILANHGGVRFDPQGDCWLDVDAFEEALRLGTARDSIAPHQLAAAAQLYRGDLLAGFFVRGCPAFEDWLVGEQERLRESAVEALRTLIDSYRRRGEYRFGIHYARRLVAIDTLSEDAHRELMRLSALAGRRSRALAQYEELEGLLRAELGVEPAEETRALHRSILADSRQETAAPAEDAEPIGPLIPLVGRAGALTTLRKCWRRALAGKAEVTLVEGESGVGKTRLVKSFLDTATAKLRSTVLKGHSYELAPRIPFLPWIEVLRNVLAEEEGGERALAAAPWEALADLVRLVPELAELRHDLPAPPPLDGEADRERLFESVAVFLEGLCRGEGSRDAEPLVLFLDDLHLADRASLELLSFLTRRLSDCPVWFVLARRDEGAEGAALAMEEEALTRLELGRLSPSEVEEIAASLVGEGQATELARFLAERAAGLPLAVAELINFLWDEGALAARDGTAWSLVQPPAATARPPGGNLDELVLLRIRRLPNSTRRLMALAAVAGQSFEAELLRKAAEEHGAVVEVGLEILLKRWLIRSFAPAWTTRRRAHDIVLWAQGARLGSFEFAHKRIRSALYSDAHPSRRRAMHAQVAAALEGLPGRPPGSDCEALAYHYAAAGLWQPAVAHLERAAERARGLCAKRTALHYYDQALEAAEHMAAATQGEEAEGWRRERERLAKRRGEIARPPAADLSGGRRRARGGSPRARPARGGPEPRS